MPLVENKKWGGKKGSKDCVLKSSEVEIKTIILATKIFSHKTNIHRNLKC